MGNLFTSKKPGEEFYVAFDFTHDIPNDTIQLAVVSVFDGDTDVTVDLTDNTKQNITSPLVNIWIKGGESGKRYRIHCAIVATLSEQEFEADGFIDVVTSIVSSLPAIPEPQWVSDFRQNFPEFSSQAKYPSATIAFWYNIGDKMLNTYRWGDLRPEGLQLFTAHQIAMAVANVESAESGNIPGTENAPVASESAGGVSISFDSQSSIEVDAGHYNSTFYGRQFIRLSRIVGAGGALIA